MITVADNDKVGITCFRGDEIAPVLVVAAAASAPIVCDDAQPGEGDPLSSCVRLSPYDGRLDS